MKRAHPFYHLRARISARRAIFRRRKAFPGWHAGYRNAIDLGTFTGRHTFVVNGLAHPVAVVGDSLFAGSMGGGGVSYENAIKNNLEKILTLPEDTIICPGMDMTTVGEEKKHNPFFAAHLVLGT